MRAWRVPLGLLLATGLVVCLAWYFDVFQSSRGANSPAVRTETWTWHGAFGPPQDEQLTQVVLGPTAQHPRSVVAQGTIHVSVTLDQGDDLSSVMLLAGEQSVTPKQRSASSGGNYDFSVAALGKGCPTPLLLYVRGRGSTPPTLSAAKMTVTYTPHRATSCQYRATGL